GSGLGGGSLINAGVALRPDPRVFRDPMWPEEVVQDGALEEGYARAARWLRPAGDPLAAGRAKYQALGLSAAGLGRARLMPAPVAVALPQPVNPAAATAAGAP